MNNKRLYVAALLCAALMAFALTGCNKEDKDHAADEPNKDAVSTVQLTEAEYEELVGKNYDELMAASGVASQAMDSVGATEEEALKIQRLKAAMVEVERVIPIYKSFEDVNAPEKYKDAQKMIQTGAVASGEVLRLTVEMATAAEDEDRIAEVRMLQKQMDAQTPIALDFSKGLQLVLGDKVGVGE